jgi:hypothetical protein
LLAARVRLKKLQVYELLSNGSVTRGFQFGINSESASAAPRLIAEGFGRYYPAVSKYLRPANGELKERSNRSTTASIEGISRR